MTTKVCSRCKEEKALTEFRVKKGRCKLCEKITLKIYRENNRDKVREKNKKYCELNKEKRNKQRSDRRKENPEKYLAKEREWRLSNSVRINKQRRDKRSLNKEKINEYRRNHRTHNIEKYKEKQKEYRDNLCDSYVRNRLCLKEDQATPELIELKRTQILISRAMKEIKNATKNNKA